MSKTSKNNLNGLTPKELELFIRARRENKAISFARGYPAIFELPNSTRPGHKRDDKYQNSARPASEYAELDQGTLLAPIDDLLHMSDSLSVYAAFCSECISQIELCREDCTHELEPKSCRSEESMSDEQILAIGTKLRKISEKRRKIKNQFEVVKLIQKAFESKNGQDAIEFFHNLAFDVTALQERQEQRVYTPRTNILDDLPQPSFDSAEMPGEYDVMSDEKVVV